MKYLILLLIALISSPVFSLDEIYCKGSINGKEARFYIESSETYFFYGVISIKVDQYNEHSFGLDLLRRESNSKPIISFKSPIVDLEFDYSPDSSPQRSKIYKGKLSYYSEPGIHNLRCAYKTHFMYW